MLAMPWPGATSNLCVLFLVVAAVWPPGLLAEQNVGCLFSERLCLEEEWCYDDFSFGRCLPATGDIDEDDLYRYNLEKEALHELSSELRRLFALGYRWNHGYTQCRLQGMLYAIKRDVDFELDSCSHLADNDLEGALKALEGQVPLDPQEVAIIKYTPSVENPHADFADEIYYPPIDNRHQEALREKILTPDAIDIMDMEDPYAQYTVMKRSWIPQMHRRSVPNFFDERYGIPRNRRFRQEPRDSLEFLQQYENDFPDENILPQERPNLLEDNNNYLTLNDMTEMYPMIKYLNDMQLTPRQIQKFLSPENYEKLGQLLDQYETQEGSTTDLEDLINERFGSQKPTQQHIPDERFTLTYNTPDSFRAGWESRDSLDDLPEPRIYYDEREGEPENEEEQESGSGYRNEPEIGIFRERKIDYGFGMPNRDEEIFRELKQREAQSARYNGDGRWGEIEPRSGVYTEGGVVPEDIQGAIREQQLNNNLDQFLEKYGLGFKRPERLDVKKPGPPFNVQITETAQKETHKHKTSNDNILSPMRNEEKRRGVHPNPTPHDAKSNEYVFVYFKNELKNWKQGKNLMGNITNLLKLEQSTFADGEVIKPHALLFKVQPNSRSLNASDVAKQIELKKDILKDLTGVEVTYAETMDKVSDQTPAHFQSKMQRNDNQFYIVIFLVCGVLAAMIIAAALLMLIRRHIKSKEKLQGLSRPDTEASKDYQDLCRARMATKGQPAGDTVHGRITSLSRESEQSPSSRSSTSSWSEEPALHNMDISTGHMVLSYMEDHLKNKDRLEQEWVALCAYVAEPCEMTVALKKENVDKNRYPEIVPYDHARVVLNELSNANNSNYINASSITDHDPRNPAYIGTQGPLPHTAPDFWQLIWEQGAVVIVMLTRLTEGGAAMCHRYWPEEGSELYHIYEVHLVSEHIWCDDYLVRSFYLKNIKTGETRTVTQFHFLSWPEAGVPASTKALLEFRRKVNKSYRGRSCPIVVHCSDGAGRTGTYCLIDMVLSRMAKGAKEIDIAATLEHLRDQRPKMVATKQQFEFVLTAVAEEVHAILKALPPQPSPAQTQEKQEK